MKSFPKESLEYDRVEVEAARDGLPYDPTTADALFAYLEPGKCPGSADWVIGEWEQQSAEQQAQNIYPARCLRGPGGTVTLEAGVWAIWFRAANQPEDPVREVYMIEIY